MHTLESSSVEKRAVLVTTSADPSGSAPEFSVTTSRRSDPGSWIAGEWASTGYVAKNGTIKAFTPTLGGSGADFEMDESSVYDVWIRWTVGEETPVRRIGSLQIL